MNVKFAGISRQKNFWGLVYDAPEAYLIREGLDNESLWPGELEERANLKAERAFRKLQVPPEMLRRERESRTAPGRATNESLKFMGRGDAGLEE